MKAQAPIVCESLRMNIDSVSSASIRSRSSSVRPMPRTTLSLSERIAPWGARRSRGELLRTLQRLARGHDLVHNPISFASCASTRRPVMIISIARA